MKPIVHFKKNTPYIIALSADIITVIFYMLSSADPAFANAYSRSVYRYGSLVVSSLTGLLPFSISELLLYLILLFIIFDSGRQLIHCFHNLKRLSPEIKKTPENRHFSYYMNTNQESSLSSGNQNVHHSTIYKIISCLKPVLTFAGHLFLIASILLTLYVFNCGINYRRTSFSAEAGLSAVSDDVNEETLAELCEYLVKEINASVEKLESQAQTPDNSGESSKENPPETSENADASASKENGEASRNSGISPVKLYNGAYLGEDATGYGISPSNLWSMGKTGQIAMESLGKKYDRLSGHYPFPKPVINSLLLSIQQVTGIYSPFTIEANYNRDIPCYDIPFTICHELSHLRGYMQEEEANFIAILATVGSDDPYFNYSGYVSAWVYAGNALARADSAKFSALYSQLNAYTLQDLRYNNEYWDRYDTKVAEAHEKINDAYLKYNGQTSGVQSYGHVVDLMLTYFEKNGNLE